MAAIYYYMLFVKAVERLFEMLLKNGVDIEAYGECGTPLQCAAAAAAGRKDIVDLLLNYGANGNANRGDPDYAASTAAIESAASGIDIDFVKNLLEAGAEGNDAFHHAAQTGHQEVFELLLVHSDNAPTQICLWITIESGNDWIVNRLLDIEFVAAALRGSLVTKVLCTACRQNRTDIFNLLIGRGVHVNPTSESLGSELLMVAVRGGHGELANQLLDHGIDMADVTESQINPLFEASLSGNMAMVNILLKRGADVNAQGKQLVPRFGLLP
ncbi:MAG: hypothetical protein Q9201_006453 [Fulgogasparrea decipioides]